VMPEKDGFRTPPQTNTRPALGQGPVRGPVLPVKELIPRGLEKLPNQEGVAKRFATDVALLHQQLRPSELPSTDRALRLWAFFTAYAEAATAGRATPEGLAAFEQVLQEQGFGHFLDARTGHTGVQAGMWVLQASAPEVARQRAETVQLVPPRDVAPEGPAAPAQAATPQAASTERSAVPRALQDSAFVAAEQLGRPAEERHSAEGQREATPLERIPGRPDTFRVNTLAAEAARPNVQTSPAEAGRAEAQDASRRGGRPGRLGANMLFNVLHRFRGEGADSAVEKEKWDRMTFGAVLLLVGVTLAAVLLVLL